MKTRYICSIGLFILGCTVGGDEEGGSGGAPAADAGLDAETGVGGSSGATGDAQTSEPPAIEGTWAQLLLYATINDIPAVGQTNGSVVTIQRVTVERTGTDLSMLVEPCAIEIDNGTTVISTIIPDAFVQSLGISPRTGTLESDGETWTYIQDPSLQLRGVKLDDAADEALPTEPTDPRVWDQDEDGNPGVTVRITGLTDGEVYVVQRDNHALDGKVVGDRVDGLADWSTEQVVLDADNPILTTPISSVRDPDATASYFRSTRIEDAVDCAAILADRDELFTR